jgi:hypothetical protein
MMQPHPQFAFNPVANYGHMPFTPNLSNLLNQQSQGNQNF